MWPSQEVALAQLILQGILITIVMLIFLTLLILQANGLAVPIPLTRLARNRLGIPKERNITD